MNHSLGERCQPALRVPLSILCDYVDRDHPGFFPLGPSVVQLPGRQDAGPQASADSAPADVEIPNR